MHTGRRMISGVWDLGADGVAVTAGRVHAGRMFDVFLLDGGDRLFALKVPALQPAEPPLFLASRTLGGVSTVWNVICVAGNPRHVLAGDPHGPWVPQVTGEDLLDDEAARLEGAGKSWNQGFVLRRRPNEQDESSVPALVTTWHYGVPLESIPRDQQSFLLPFLLLQLWNAVSDALHGDLNGANILVSPDKRRVTLIDPGAQVLSRRGAVGPTNGADALTFVTTPKYYPVLPPYLQPAEPLSAGLTLREHWEGFVLSMTLSEQACSFPAGENVRGWVVTRDGGRFLTRRATPGGGPHPADALALGILYYEALTGHSPFGMSESPAWVGPAAIDDRLEGCEGIPETLANGVIPPSAINPTVKPAEDTLALALLDLQVASADHLLDLALTAARR